MIADLARDFLPETLSAQVCIAGGGPAGTTLALELAARRISVILLEGGGREVTADNQELCEGENLGHPMRVSDGRYRVLGGASTHWTGRCAQLDDIDFEARDWAPLSGWPIGRSALTPHLERASRYCGFEEGWEAGEAAASELRNKLPAFDEDKIAPFIWRYAPQAQVRRYRDWGRDYQDQLQESGEIRVVLSASVAGFEGTDDGESVRAFQARSLNGRTLRVEAQQFVVCCGGAENARLLLLGAQAVTGLRANDTMVGRCFMQHPRGRVARLETDQRTSARLQDRLNVLNQRKGVQYEAGLALPASVQRREGLLNASIYFNYAADPGSAWERFKRARNEPAQQAIKDIAVAATAPHKVAHNLWRRGVMGLHPHLETDHIDLIIDLEQLPDPESRVRLSDKCDALGVPRIVIDWRLSELERQTALRFTTLAREEFQRLGLGEVVLEPWLTDTGAIPDGALAGTYHHIGSTRMASDAEHGVVDAECRVFGTRNLYAQGCSVFATGGHANPTFSIVMLAVRQAEILARMVAKSPVASAA